MNEIEQSRVQEITKLHVEIAGYIRVTLDKAIRIGELLSEQKELLQHGEFGEWIERNLPFSDRTVIRYMKAYDNRDKLKTDRVSDLTEAYRLLEQPKDAYANMNLEDAFDYLKLLLEDVEELSCRRYLFFAKKEGIKALGIPLPIIDERFWNSLETLTKNAPLNDMTKIQHILLKIGNKYSVDRFHLEGLVGRMANEIKKGWKTSFGIDLTGAQIMTNSDRLEAMLDKRIAEIQAVS